jgi:hypothetical protein
VSGIGIPEPSAAPAPVAAASPTEPVPPRAPTTTSEGIKLVGGLVAVVSGLVALLIIAVVAMILVKGTTESVVAIATGSFGVIGTVIGAYFGVKVGSDGTQAAVSGMRQEAAKAQVFAAHLPEGKAAEVLASAQSVTHQAAAR